MSTHTSFNKVNLVSRVEFGKLNINSTVIEPQIEYKLDFGPRIFIFLNILTILTLVFVGLMIHYTITFGEPDIWYLQCSKKIDKDHKNYNESNPLDLCNKFTDDIGTLKIEYPIRKVKDVNIGCLIVIILHLFFAGAIFVRENSKKDLLAPISFWLFLFSILLYRSSLNVEGSYVCPRLEDTFSYLESDQDNQDEYPDYINITFDECEDLFSYIPGWILTFLLVNMIAFGCFTFYMYRLFITYLPKGIRDKLALLLYKKHR